VASASHRRDSWPFFRSGVDQRTSIVTSLVVSMVELSSIHDEVIGIHTCLMDAQRIGVTMVPSLILDPNPTPVGLVISPQIIPEIHHSRANASTIFLSHAIRHGRRTRSTAMGNLFDMILVHRGDNTYNQRQGSYGTKMAFDQFICYRQSSRLTVAVPESRS
jgi:hypothetical protein